MMQYLPSQNGKQNKHFYFFFSFMYFNFRNYINNILLFPFFPPNLPQKPYLLSQIHGFFISLVVVMY